MKPKVDFRLLLITDRKLCKNLPSQISRACSAGINAVLLREKDLSANELLELSLKIKTITAKTHSKLIISERFDIAVLSKAEGVHSPENGLVPPQKTLPKNLLKGRSVHSASSAIAAEKFGFDYLLFGPVYRTPEKVKFGPPMGLEKLKKVCESVNIPVFAVGGINPKRAGKCLRAGAYGAAVIRELMNSENIKLTVNEFKVEMGEL